METSDTATLPSIAVVYESMFGNTRQVAEAIAAGIRATSPVAVVPIIEASNLNSDFDMIIVGAPTHAHGLSRPESRREAVDWANAARNGLALDEAWSDRGVREWISDFPSATARFAAFDTRVDMPRIFTGSAAVAIDRKLRKLGAHHIAEPNSFLVDKSSRLLPGEVDRARDWGAELAFVASRTVPLRR